MGVSGSAPYRADQCRLYPPKFSLGAHLPSVSCIPLLRTNGYLSYKSQMPIPEEALPASVLPALPPPQSGLGALLRAPFCHYVMSCPGCSPWSAVIWPLGGLPPPSGECPLVQAQGPTSHLPPRASMLLSPECFGRLKGQIKCSKK